MKKIIILLFSLIFLLSVCVFPVSAYKPDFDITAEGALLVNLDTDIVIFSRNADKRLFPASLTKIMTAVIVAENSPNLATEEITVTKEAVNSILGTGLVVAHLQEGEKLTAEQLLHMILISSAADATETVARHYAESEDAFVDMMNERASQLGMANTHFENTHGLHDENHYTTANDMYLLAKHALSIPAIKDIVSKTRYVVEPTNKSDRRLLATTNYMTNPAYPSYYYKYASGVKTGFTDQAGRCLVSTASKNGYNYLCIVLNCMYKDSSGNRVKKDFEDTKALYEWAFSTFEYKPVTIAGKPIGEAKVELSSDTDYVSVVPKEEFMYMLPKNADESTITVEVELTADTVDAPIKKGQSMGIATYYYAGERLGEVEVVAYQDVKRDGLLAVGRVVKNIVTSWVFIGILVSIGVFILSFILAVLYLNRDRRKRRRRYKGW